MATCLAFCQEDVVLADCSSGVGSLSHAALLINE